MKVLLIREERFDELIEKFLADLLTKGPDSTRPELPVDYRTINFHIRTLQDAVKKGPMGL